MKQKIDRFPKNQIRKNQVTEIRRISNNIKSLQVWKNGKSRAWKIFCENTFFFLINQLISRNICKSKFPRLQWKNQKFSFLIEKKFREINLLVISLVKTLLSRNFCQKREIEFPQIPHYYCRKSAISWNHHKVWLVQNSLISRNFCEQNSESKYLQFCCFCFHQKSKHFVRSRGFISHCML